MTSIVLTDLAEARMEVISFFIVGYLVLTFVVKFLWNRLAKGIPAIPVINFRKALCLMLVSGLFMYVILTMISGARELMTPGAWEKQGITYKLSNSEEARRANLGELKRLLWEYAANHDGNYPADRLDPAINRDAWRLPDRSGYCIFYPPGTGGEILVSEPMTAGKKRYVILKNGEIQKWSHERIQRELQRKR
ncbi:MAG: hypothetical protein ACSHYF_10470 [Verrucomicrobiaceae bacterium]